MRAFLSGLLVVAAATSVHAGANDYFKETEKNFGTTPRGPLLKHYFIVTNTSNQVVNIGQPRVSCGCVSASVLKSQIAPGETTAVLAMMDSRRIPYANSVKTVTVYVPFLTPYQEEVHLRVQAIARDDLVLSPDTLAIGTVRTGAGGKATTKVTLFNNSDWKVTKAASNGIYVKAAAKEVSRQGGQVSYEITATLDPECPVGNWTSDIWLETNAPGVEKLRIPVTVRVVSPIQVNPVAVAFGDVKVGATSEQKVILQGNSPFELKAIKDIDGPVQVSQVANGSRPVHILKITLSPTTVGDIAQTIEITTDSKEMPTVKVPLTAHIVK